MLVAQQHVDPPRVFFLQAPDLIPVSGLRLHGHGAVVVVRVAVVGKAQRVKALRQGRAQHPLGGVAPVGEGGVGMNV